MTDTVRRILDQAGGGNAVGALLNKAGVDSSPQEIGIAGFKTYSRVRGVVTRSAEIPLSFVENGSPLNDHIIKQPLGIQIRGNVGDIFLPEAELSATVGAIQAEIGNVTQYLPARTQTQVSKVFGLINDVSDAIRKLDAIVDSGYQILDLFGDESAAQISNQLAFIEKMESLYDAELPISVTTRYKKYNSMVITNLIFEVDNEDNSIDFTIDFQRWRTARLDYVAVKRNVSNGTKGALNGKSDKGVQRGDKVDQSLATSILESLGFSIPGGE